MEITRTLILVPTLSFVSANARSQQVHYNYDRGTNFASYKTYQWVNTPSGTPTYPGASNLPGRAELS
jgi:hypothetical protein